MNESLDERQHDDHGSKVYRSLIETLLLPVSVMIPPISSEPEASGGVCLNIGLLLSLRNPSQVGAIGSGPDVNLAKPPRGEEVPRKRLEDFESNEALGQSFEGRFRAEGLKVELGHAEHENRQRAEKEQECANAGDPNGEPP